MAKVVVIHSKGCEQELEIFLKKHRKNILAKAETAKGITEITRIIKGLRSLSGHSERLSVNTAGAIDILRIRDIVHCESHRSYTQVHLANGTSITVSKTLRQFEEELSRHRFVRIHQSYLVNLEYVVKYVKSKTGQVVLENGTKLPVATRKKENLFKELEML